MSANLIRSRTFTIRAWGPFACFRDPSLSPEIISYVVPPHSAAAAIFRCVFDKPAVKWQVEKVHLLAPIRRERFRSNHVKHDGSVPFAAGKHRTQVNVGYLAHVNYAIFAHFEVVEPDRHPLPVFEDMFLRRARRGENWRHRPFFGQKQCGADWEYVEENDRGKLPSPIAESRDLGLMYYDTLYEQRNYGSWDLVQPWLFRAQLGNGVLEYPTWDRVIQSGLKLGRPVRDLRSTARAEGAVA